MAFAAIMYSYPQPISNIEYNYYFHIIHKQQKMKRLFSAPFIVYLLLVLFFGSLVSCSDSEDDQDESNLKMEIIGHWYYTHDNQIYSISLYENGTGETRCHTYSEKKWKEEASSLQYTLSDNRLILKPAAGDVLTGEIGIMGNSMSFSNGGVTIMLTRYNGNKKEIDELRKDIEDNWLEQEPDNSYDEDTFFKNEENIITAIDAIYSNLRDYEFKQMLLEKIRLTKQDFYNRPAALITPNSSEVSDAWTAAYKTITMANMVIHALENNKSIDIDENKLAAYANEARVVRCLVYYNIAQLWGNIPYITGFSSDNISDILPSSILSSKNISDEINNTLQEIKALPEGKYRVTMETIKALQGEIALSSGNKEEAKSLLANCHPDFHIFINEPSSPEMYDIFGDKIPNYTSEKVELLLHEANLRDAGEASFLIDEWKNKKQYWGYWFMLKRTNQAQAVCGCEEHELLMPIPQSEIYRMPALKQNPGY